jgi:hypothetical protein
MAVVGIIAEYNPFHYGHGFQMEAVRWKHPAAYIVIAMSGSFTQRGAPCVLDKWTRACHAVAGGADLVLELPFGYACRSAQDFARGGVSLLSCLGIVTHLSFGTEAEDTSLLSELAEQIDSTSVQTHLREHLEQGCSYAGALTRALMRDTVVPEELLRAPNNILAIEYLRALQSLAPQILPLGIQRASAQHNDVQLHTGITSASSIRHALRASPPSWDRMKKSVLPCTLNDLKEAHMRGVLQEDRLLELLRYLLLVTDTPALMEIQGVSEGIEHRLIRSLETAADYTDFLAKASAKRYPQSRIARLIIHLLLCFKKAHAAEFDANGALYIRPLAFNARGRELLRTIKDASPLPIVTRTADYLTGKLRKNDAATLSPLQRMLAFDTRATELRSLALPTLRTQNHRTDFIMSPIFFQKERTEL